MRTKKTSKGTPVAISKETTLEKKYNFPPKCRGKHTYDYGRMTITFLGNDYLPYPMFGDACIKCGTRK